MTWIVVPKCRCDRMIQPRCGWRGCDELAVISVWMHRLTEGGEHFRFMCALHYDRFIAPIPGLDRPEGADEFWRPSISDMIRLARIKAAFESSRFQEPPPMDDRRRLRSAAQLSQLQLLRTKTSRALPE